MNRLFYRDINGITTIPRRISEVDNFYMHSDTRQEYKTTVGKPEGNRLFRRLRHGLKYNIKI